MTEHVCGSTDTGDGRPCQRPVLFPWATCHSHELDPEAVPEVSG